MNCTKCGYPAHEHTIPSYKRVGVDFISCRYTSVEIELSHLQARFTMARELIACLTHNGQLSPRLMTPETRGLWERWQAEEMKP